MNKTLLILLFSVLPLIILAQIDNPIGASTFGEIINNIIDVIFTLAVAVMPAMIVIGGFLFVTAGGDINRIEQGKRLLTWAVIGFLVVLLAKGAVNLLNEILGV